MAERFEKLLNEFSVNLFQQNTEAERVQRVQRVQRALPSIEPP